MLILTLLVSIKDIREMKYIDLVLYFLMKEMLLLQYIGLGILNSLIVGKHAHGMYKTLLFMEKQLV
nr:MAG TPA: hypothetical protein [Caudoviricetes sp.]